MSRLKRSVRLVAAAGILVGALGVLGWSVIQSVRAPAPTSAAADGFDLTVWPKSIEVTQYFTVHHIIALAGKNGMSGNVSLSVSGLPAGTVGEDSSTDPFYFCASTCLASPSTPAPWTVAVKDGEKTTLNPNFGTYDGEDVPVGTYTVTVTASAAGYETKSDSFTLKVVDNGSEACTPIYRFGAVSPTADQPVKYTVTAGDTISGTLSYTHEPCLDAVGDPSRWAATGVFTTNGNAAGKPGLDDGTMTFSMSPTSGSLAEDLMAEGTVNFSLKTSSATPNGTYALLPAMQAGGKYYPVSVIGIKVTGGTTGSGKAAESGSTTPATGGGAPASSSSGGGTESTTVRPVAQVSTTAGGASLSLSRQEAGVGETVGLTGNGFTAGEELVAYFDPYVIAEAEQRQSGRFELGKVTAGRTGRATLEVTIPQGATAGSHAIRLTNGKFGDGAKSADATLTVSKGDGVPTMLDAALTTLWGGALGSIADVGDAAAQTRLVAQAHNLVAAATDPNYPKEPITASPVPMNPTDTLLTREVRISIGDDTCEATLAAQRRQSLLALLHLDRLVPVATASSCTTESIASTVSSALPLTGELASVVDAAKAARASAADRHAFEMRVYATSAEERELLTTLKAALEAERITDFSFALATRLAQPDITVPAVEVSQSTDPAVPLIDLALTDDVAEVRVTYLSPESGFVKRVLRPTDGKIQLRLIPYAEYFIEVVYKNGSRQWYQWRYRGDALGSPEAEHGKPYLTQILEAAQPKSADAVRDRIGELAAQRVGYTSLSGYANTVRDEVLKRVKKTRQQYVDEEMEKAFAGEVATCRSTTSSVDGLQPFANADINVGRPYYYDGNVTFCGMSRFTGRWLKASDRPQDLSYYPEVEHLPATPVRIPESEYRTRSANALAAAEQAYSQELASARQAVVAEFSGKDGFIVREAGDGIEVYPNTEAFSTTDVAIGGGGGVVAIGGGGGVVAMTSYPVMGSSGQTAFVPTARAAEESADDIRLVPTNYIDVTVSGKVHGVLLADPADRLVGHNAINGSTVTQVSGASYVGDGSATTRLNVPGLMDGEYRVVVYGLEDGDYTGTVRIAAGGTVTERPISGSVKKGQSSSTAFRVALETETVATGELVAGSSMKQALYAGAILVLILVAVVLGYVAWLRKSRGMQVKAKRSA